jgi:hypothetical protein
MRSICSSRIIANGSENHRPAPKACAPSRALCSWRGATPASFRQGRPRIAGMCDTFAQLAFVSAPTIPTRICFRPCLDPPFRENVCGASVEHNLDPETSLPNADRSASVDYLLAGRVAPRAPARVHATWSRAWPSSQPHRRHPGTSRRRSTGRAHLGGRGKHLRHSGQAAAEPRLPVHARSVDVYSTYSASKGAGAELSRLQSHLWLIARSLLPTSSNTATRRRGCENATGTASW